MFAKMTLLELSWYLVFQTISDLFQKFENSLEVFILVGALEQKGRVQHPVGVYLLIFLSSSQFQAI